MPPKSDYLVQQVYYTPNQVAELLRVTPVTVRHWALDGKLAFNSTPGGHRRFEKREIERFAEAHNINLNITNPKELRILIVDDNRELSDYFVEFLSAHEAVDAVDIAHDGFSAGAKMHSFKPTLVILDLMMPGLNGVQTCRSIKLDPETRDVRVIAITGYPSEENVSRIMEHGAEICLTKPVRAPDLLSAIGIVETRAK